MRESVTIRNWLNEKYFACATKFSILKTGSFVALCSYVLCISVRTYDCVRRKYDVAFYNEYAYLLPWTTLSFHIENVPFFHRWNRHNCSISRISGTKTLILLNLKYALLSNKFTVCVRVCVRALCIYESPSFNTSFFCAFICFFFLCAIFACIVKAQFQLKCSQITV